MATLWTVTHPGIAVPLLMKVPKISEGEDPAAIVSFEMEQMIVPRLAGPHVPACFGSGTFERQPYIVIERIPGKTLYDRLGDLPLPYDEARSTAGKIATALADLHRQNVIHHDIKPSSVMNSAGWENSTGAASFGEMITRIPIRVLSNSFSAKPNGIRTQPCEAA